MREEEKTRILREYEVSYAAMKKTREEYDQAWNRWQKARLEISTLFERTQ